MTDIPEWAFKRMDAQVAHEPRQGHPRYTEVGCAFARYIAEHEEPPVDPLEEVIGEIQDTNTLLSDGKIAERIRDGLAKRGLQIVPVQS